MLVIRLISGVSETLVIPSFAKLNLVLAVSPPEPQSAADGGRNPRAGWHRICSLFSCVNLCDELALTALPSGLSRFSVRWAPDAPSPSPLDWPIEKDLIFRAHTMVEELLGRELPVEAVLTKRIPVGGGMGGGSSNGAAMLRGLASLFRIDLELLKPIASKLGSDVSFFLDSDQGLADPARPALVEGFGDRITRRAAFEAGIVLVCPRISCPTPEVYRAFDRWLASNPAFHFRQDEVRATSSSNRPLDPRSLFNDLAEPAFDVAPELGAIHAAASRAHSPIHVTGSGSTLFALVAPSESTAVAAALRAQLPAGTAVIATALR